MSSKEQFLLMRIAAMEERIRELESVIANQQIITSWDVLQHEAELMGRYA